MENSPIRYIQHWKNNYEFRIFLTRHFPFNCENEYLVLALREETTAEAEVGSIVWAFRRLEKPRSREMSARGYALHSVCRQHNFLIFFIFCVPSIFSQVLPIAAGRILFLISNRSLAPPGKGVENYRTGQIRIQQANKSIFSRRWCKKVGRGAIILAVFFSSISPAFSAGQAYFLLC